MSQSDPKKLADQLRKEKQYPQALEIYRKLWEVQKSAWTGYFIALCLRQSNQLVECRAFHDEFDRIFPGMVEMKSERLWLDYRQHIKDQDYLDFVEAGEAILARSDQYSKETDKVFIKTVLAVARRLPYSPTEKLLWLDRLDQSILDNNVFRFGDMTYPADRKRYFMEYALALTELNEQNRYVADQMAKLGFSGTKHNEFLKYITESFTFKAEGKNVYYSVRKLALTLKALSEEIHLRRRIDVEKIYIPNKTLSVSDLSHYSFCPVSYAIHRTFKIYSSESWQKDEWKKEKLYLADRYRRFHESGTFEHAFSDTSIAFDSEFKDKFKAIFESKVELNNVTAKQPMIMRNDAGTMNGAPDYIFLHPSNVRYVVTEKFSHKNSADSKQPFESDLLKHFAFLQEFKNYNLHFGLFLTWYYSHVEVEGENEGEKKIVINDYRLTKIKMDDKNMDVLRSRMAEVNDFVSKGKLNVDGQLISYPQKCLNCSVVSYCHHKTGKYNEVSLPYELTPLAGIDVPLAK